MLRSLFKRLSGLSRGRTDGQSTGAFRSHDAINDRQMFALQAQGGAFNRWVTPSVQRILGLTVFLMLTGNGMLVSQLLHVYPWRNGNLGFLLSIVLFLSVVTGLFLLCVIVGRRFGFIATAWLLLSSAVCAHFMDGYGAIIDVGMLENTLQTSASEIADLVGWQMVGKIFLLGIVPAVWLYRRPVRPSGFLIELRSRLLAAFLLMLLAVACVAPYTARYASFIREHKFIRYYTNPAYPTWSLVNFARKKIQRPMSTEIKTVAADAKLRDVQQHADRRELIILVVGETARADRFALNGYHRPTTPRLAAEDVVSFRQASSCGTATTVSVPCMFSGMTPERFSISAAASRENVLDVLQRNGVEILWRDNNSDSKGVAARIPFEDFRSPDVNPVCDLECRDIGMLAGLDKWVAARRDRDLLIVLHQIGNHGPAYYKRYPVEFEHFKPVCKSSELSACTREELDNAYDNAIRYTDHFLGEVIGFLKRHDQTRATAMLYVSDHGESLGENGLYLHGAPRMIAPVQQTHIASVAWTGRHFGWSVDQLKAIEHKPLSHTDLFCALLYGFDIETEVCRPTPSSAWNTLHPDALAKPEPPARSR